MTTGLVMATGRLNLWTGRNVHGRPARLLGLLAMAPLVFALSAGVAIGVVSGGQVARKSLWILELAVAIAAMAGVYVIGWPLSQSHAPGGAPEGWAQATSNEALMRMNQGAMTERRSRAA